MYNMYSPITKGMTIISRFSFGESWSWVSEAQCCRLVGMS